MSCRKYHDQLFRDPFFHETTNNKRFKKYQDFFAGLRIKGKRLFFSSLRKNSFN